MTAFSDYSENNIIDQEFRTATMPKATALYIALFTSDPTDANAGIEVTGGSYARVNLPALDSNWNGTHGNTTGPSSGTSGQTSNAVTVTFPSPTALWGAPVTHFAIYDALTGGNLKYHAPLNVAKNINSGDPAPAFAPGTLVVTLN